MLDYQRECSPDKVLSSDCITYLILLHIAETPFLTFQELLEVLSLVSWTLTWNTYANYLGEFPCCSLATVKSIYGTELLKSVLSIYRVSEQSPKLAICGASGKPLMKKQLM